MKGPQTTGITKENLERLYVNDPNATLDSVGRLLGCNRESIRRWMRRYGLPIRQRTSSRSPRKSHTQKLADRDWLAAELIAKTAVQIGRELGTDDQNVVYWAKKHGLWEASSERSESIQAWFKKAYPDGRIGELAANWRGGRRIIQGYVWLYCPDHPQAHGGVVQEHRLVMEQQLGRYLESDEIVHHINGIRSDNRPENLRVMKRGAHVRGHFKASHEVLDMRERVKEQEAEIARLRAENRKLKRGHR